MNIPQRMRVVEVGPRDGLQSLPKWIETDVKVRMVDRLSDAGFPVIEVTSFASPKVVPNLRDAEEVMARIARRPGTSYRALVPNARGAERALAADRPDELLGLITASETYLRKNQNMSLDEAVEQAILAFRIADKASAGFVMAIGMAFWCAYEGEIGEDKVLSLIDRFWSAGMRRFYVAGSVGMEDPAHVGRLIGRIAASYPTIAIGYHVHNMAGFGTANILAAIDAGAEWIEGSICGIGGGVAMPGFMGAVGNIPSEDAVAMLNEMGIDTGIGTDVVLGAARDIAELLSIVPNSHAANGGNRSEILRAHGHG
jgi:hydroxymethylglutaryl-CoA lyase